MSYQGSDPYATAPGGDPLFDDSYGAGPGGPGARSAPRGADDMLYGGAAGDHLATPPRGIDRTAEVPGLPREPTHRPGPPPDHPGPGGETFVPGRVTAARAAAPMPAPPMYPAPSTYPAPPPPRSPYPAPGAHPPLGQPPDGPAAPGPAAGRSPQDWQAGPYGPVDGSTDRTRPVRRAPADEDREPASQPGGDGRPVRAGRPVPAGRSTTVALSLLGALLAVPALVVVWRAAIATPPDAGAVVACALAVTGLVLLGAGLLPMLGAGRDPGDARGPEGDRVHRLLAPPVLLVVVGTAVLVAAGLAAGG